MGPFLFERSHLSLDDLFMKTLLLTLLFPFIAQASICVEQLDDKGEVSWLHCPRNLTTVASGTITDREVLWQLPAGTAPRKGWPVVLLSQGSWFPIEFSRPRNLPFGGFHEVRLIQTLLDNGYAVIAPRATLQIGWTTNLPLPDYKKTSDYRVLKEVLAKIQKGEFGALNSRQLYATGISSGGYNTSRLALTFPKTFKAIAIQSASYATCLGPLCRIPDSLPSEHPPTLLLHGGIDLTVPLFTARKYHSKLEENGIEVETFVNPTVGHGWLPESPEKILEWFETH